MELIRKYYTEAMRRIQEEDENQDREEMLRILAAVDEYKKRHPTTLNAGRVKWFEALSVRVLDFAEACDLDVVIRTSEEGCGTIEFRTSYFEVSRMGPAETRALWLYLCSEGELSISHYNDVFAIEFQFDLS